MEFTEAESNMNDLVSSLLVERLEGALRELELTLEERDVLRGRLNTTLSRAATAMVETQLAQAECAALKEQAVQLKT